LAGILDRSPHGLILASPDGRLRFANLAAERLLAEAGGLRAVGGRLTAARPEDARRLREMIASAGAQPGDGGGEVGGDVARDGRTGGCMALPAPSRASPLSVTVTPMEPAGSRALGAGRFVLVCVTDLDTGAVLPEQRLRELFGLTTAEARVAQALFEGHSLSEVAAALGLSRNTVHVQLGRIFEKTGVNRQSGLMRLMMQAVGFDLI
jgi:DNA-binding CsgD family transcriptional regulator